MKRDFVFAVFCLLSAAPIARGQETPRSAAPVLMSQQEIDENYKSLQGEVANLKEANDDWRKRFDEIRRQFATLHEQMDKPNPTYATAEDFKRLADAIKEVDRKREEDTKRILDEFAKLGNAIATPPAGNRGSARQPEPPTTAVAQRGDETGNIYLVKKNDTFGTIALAYRALGKKEVTEKRIADANPGAESGHLKIGQKLFIPFSKTADGK